MSEEKKNLMTYSRIIPKIVNEIGPVAAIICAQLVSNRRDYHPIDTSLSYQTQLNIKAVQKALKLLIKHGYVVKDSEDGFYPTDLLMKMAKKSGFLVEDEILYHQALLPIQRVLYGHMIYRPQSLGNDELSLYTGLSESSVRRVKKDLAKAGVLELTKQGGGRSQRNSYELCLKTQVTEHGWNPKPSKKSNQDANPELTPAEPADLDELRSYAEDVATQSLEHYAGDRSAALYLAAYDIIFDTIIQSEQADIEPMEELIPASEDGRVPPVMIPMSELVELIDHNALNAVEARLKERGDQVAHPASYYKKCLLNAAKTTARSFEKID